MHGLLLCRRIRAAKLREPIMLMAVSEWDLAQGSDDVAAVDEIRIKPFSVRDVAAGMRTLLRRHQTESRPNLDRSPAGCALP